MTSIGSTLNGKKLLDFIRQAVNSPKIKYLYPPKQITGGFETKIYRIQLQGTPDSLPEDLVLRLLPKNYSDSTVILNKTLHNYLNSIGYPTPKVHITCRDKTLLGGAFYLMDYVEGEMMLKNLSDSTPRMLAETHARLHRIDPEPLMDSLDQVGIPRDHYIGFASRIAFVKREGREWMEPALKWLIDNYPKDEKLSICHGDLHLLNVLVKGNQVTGVLDWSFRVDNAAYDIATTVILSKYLGSTVVPDYDFVGFADKFLEEYRRLMPVDEDVLSYFYAMKIFFIWMDVDLGVDVWLLPGIQKSISDQFYEITGIRITQYL